MSTHAFIGIVKRDKIRYISLHHDGYIGYAGNILQQHYNTKSKVSKLIDLGGLDSIFPKLKQCILLSEGDSGKEVQTCHFTDFPTQEFTYVFYDGRWLFHNRTENYVDLTDALEEIKQLEIIEAAIEGLKDYHRCLKGSTINKGALVSSQNKIIFWITEINVPDTGNRQLDYEKVKNQVEYYTNQFQTILNNEEQ